MVKDEKDLGEVKQDRGSLLVIVGFLWVIIGTVGMFTSMLERDINLMLLIMGIYLLVVGGG